MIRRILRKVRFLSLETDIKTFDDFKKANALEKLDSEFLEENKRILEPIYKQYITDVSRADMAASLELAAFMLSVCKIKQYKKLLDMGSGLSSFVFRYYAKEHPDVKVFSVDDDAEWLEKTKGFLRQHELSTDNVYTLDHFLELKEDEFDCILHDLNFVEIRIRYTEQLLEASKAGGIVIFDDVHKPDYRYGLLSRLKKIPSRVYSLKPSTFDSYGRFAIGVIKR